MRALRLWLAGLTPYERTVLVLLLLVLFSIWLIYDFGGVTQ